MHRTFAPAGNLRNTIIASLGLLSLSLIPTTSASAAVLYSQLDNAAGNGAPSQEFEQTFSAYDAMGADDFAVSGTWLIDEVFIVGSGIENATSAQGSFDLAIYEDNAGLPGSVVFSQTEANFVMNGGDVTLSFGGSPFSLNTGIYWVSVVADFDFGSFSQWFWSNRSTQTLSPGAWQNPDGGFGNGCTTWDTQVNCSVGGAINPDFLFEIRGTQSTVTNVPAPAMLSLLGLGLIGVCLARRKSA